MQLADQTLSIINDDQSFETIQSIIGSILEMIDEYQWTIGGILVFLRFRAGHIPLVKFNRPADKSWPADFLNYLADRTNDNPERANQVDELLHWHRLVFDEIVVLYDEKEITVWEISDDHFTDYQYRQYLDMLTKNLSRKLNSKTMWAYYITALKFPVSARAKDRTWTFHFETYQYYQLNHGDDNDGGNENLSSLVVSPAMQLDEFLSMDISTTAEVRDMMKEMRNDQRGFRWGLELPDELPIYVGNERKVVIRFDKNTPDKNKEPFFAGAGKLFIGMLLRQNEFYLKGDKLFIGKDYVGHLPLMDKDSDVDRAIIQLADKMRWSVSGAESFPVQTPSPQSQQ